MRITRVVVKSEYVCTYFGVSVVNGVSMVAVTSRSVVKAFWTANVVVREAGFISVLST